MYIMYPTTLLKEKKKGKEGGRKGGKEERG